MHKLTAIVVAAATSVGVAAAETSQCHDAQVPEAALRTSLTCDGDLAGATRPTVLLVAGTTLNPPENFDWGYEPALRERGHPVCRVQVPDNSMGDIQTAAVYIAYAIRTAYQRAGRQVAVVGFSQGGMSPRWALRFFPDTRAMVADLISLSGSHHGSFSARRPCGEANGCAAAIWQQRADSAFMSRLNDGRETYPEVSYTALYTIHDDILTSNAGPSPTSALGGGSNVASIALQSLCPDNPADHFRIGTHDPVAYALMVDALDHDGPARAERVSGGAAPGSAALCESDHMPGVDAEAVRINGGRYVSSVQTALTQAQPLGSEPAPACYTLNAR